MNHTTLVSSETLYKHLNNSSWVVVDCRFDLTDPQAGFETYRKGHIPGAVYANLDRDLAGPITAESGRHPLPKLETFKETLGRWGIDSSKQVAVYDDWFGALAARLWWMLRFLGHMNVAVLDGGLPKWQKEAKPLETGIQRNVETGFDGEPHVDWMASLEEVQRRGHRPEQKLIDSRDAARYRGEYEPLDRVPGHIPGALNHFFGNNVDEAGTLLSPGRLRQQFESLLGDTKPDQTIFYCGSGVSACQNLLAMEHAGLPGAKLFVGSWSQWCKDPQRAVETESD